MKHIKHILMLLILAPVSVWGGSWQHFVGLTLAGGEANVFAHQPSITIHPLAGGAGQAMFVYEARANIVYIQAGAGVDYQFMRSRIGSFVEERNAVDITREQHIYQYRYSSLTEQQQLFNAQLMAQVGFLPTENIYLSLGLKMKFPLSRHYSSSANMLTAGKYERWAAEYIEDRPQFGFYPETEYSYSGKFFSLKTWLTPTIEIGGTWDIGRTTLRGGIYADYGFRLGDKFANNITNYANVNLNASSQSQENLHDNIRLNSILDSHYLKTFSHLEVGLKFTVLFNVTTFRVPCHCMP